MTEYLGCDYAGRADFALPVMRQQGMSFVCRYLPSPGGAWKQLTKDEAVAIAAAGLGVVSIWEMNPVDRDWFTPQRGTREGDAARGAARVLGQPAGRPIYATVDYDAQEGDLPAIDGYMNSFEAALGGEYLLGVYGGFRVIEHCAARGVRWLWQTYAWSGGRLHPAAVLYQYHNGVMIAGAQTDLNRAFNDPGWWRPDGKLVEPVPAPPEGDEIVPLVRTGDQGLAVKILQQMLNAVGGGSLAVDGRFGPATSASVRAFQTSRSLGADGVVGPITWAALAEAKPAADPAWLSELTAALDEASAKLEQARALVGDQ